MTSEAPSRDRPSVRFPGFAWSLPVIVGTLLTFPSTLLAAPRVVVIETKDTAIIIGAKDGPDRARGRRQIAEAVSTSVERAGGQIVVPAPPLAEECNSHDCVKQVGAAAGAQYVLLIDAVFDQDSFKLHLDLWSTSTGVHLDGEGQDCDGCSVNELTKALRDRTTLLCDRVFRAAQSAPPQEASALPPAPGPTTVTAPPLVTQSPPVPPRKGSATRWLGWSLVGAGAAGVIAGGILWHMDGELRGCSDGPNGDLCPTVWKTEKLGIPLTIGGAGAALAGGWLIYETRPREQATISITSRGIALTGSF